MKIKVYLTAPSLNISGIHKEEWEDSMKDSREELIDLIEFQYFENNYACDHNRALFLNLEDSDNEDKYNCVSNVVKIEKITEILEDGSEILIIEGDVNE